ncbi:MAG: hypothetical protein RLZZ427_489, partial [Pseudomonadota bacterium]
MVRRASFHRWGVKANRRNPFPPTALPVLLATALLAACAAPPPPAPAPLPSAPPPLAAPAPAPPPPPADWRDAPRTQGDWRWDLAQGNVQAVYGPAAAPPLVKLTCDRAAGTVVLARNAADGGSADAVPMALITTSISRALISEPAATTPGWLV